MDIYLDPWSRDVMGIFRQWEQVSLFSWNSLVRGGRGIVDCWVLEDFFQVRGSVTWRVNMKLVATRSCDP